MQCMSTTETLGTEEPQDYDKRKWVSAHTHKALCNKFQTIIPVFSSPSGQTDNLKPLGRHQHAGLEQHHLCTSSATSSREFRAVTWNQFILNPSWPCSKQPTAKVRDLIHLWRKIRELHQRRSYESLLSQPVLIYECPNTAACTTTQTKPHCLVTAQNWERKNSKEARKAHDLDIPELLHYSPYSCFNTMFLLMFPSPPLLHYPHSSGILTTQRIPLWRDEKFCLKLPVLSPSPTLADFTKPIRKEIYFLWWNLQLSLPLKMVQDLHFIKY